jgi:GNAT superfamily N-acetyltransferase
MGGVPAFRIRPARPADGDDVVRLVRALAAFESLPVDDDLGARLVADAFGERPPFGLVVAEVDGHVRGYALFFYTYSTFRAQPSLYLEDLYVEDGVRGRGIGTAIMRELAQLAVDRGCARFEWNVLDWNDRAQRFYRALGAEVHPEWWTCRVEGDALGKLGGATSAADSTTRRIS